MALFLSQCSQMSPNPDVREQCAWCLGNIAGDCTELRDFVLDSGALDPLLQNCEQPASVSMLRNMVRKRHQGLFHGAPGLSQGRGTRVVCVDPVPPH